MKINKRLYLVVLVLGIALVGIFLFQEIAVNADTGERDEIMKAMEKGYDAISYAQATNDPSKLSEIFIDTSDYKLPDATRKNVEAVFGANIAENAGYLTAMQAKYITGGKVNANWQALQDKAKAENRSISKEEMQEFLKKNDGQVPPSGMYKTSDGKNHLTYDKIEITGDRSTAYYDTGLAYDKAILIKINGKWFIASIEPIHIHY